MFDGCQSVVDDNFSSWNERDKLALLWHAQENVFSGVEMLSKTEKIKSLKKLDNLVELLRLSEKIDFKYYVPQSEFFIPIQNMLDSPHNDPMTTEDKTQQHEPGFYTKRFEQSINDYYPSDFNDINKQQNNDGSNKFNHSIDPYTKRKLPSNSLGGEEGLQPTQNGIVPQPLLNIKNIGIMPQIQQISTSNKELLYKNNETSFKLPIPPFSRNPFGLNNPVDLNKQLNNENSKVKTQQNPIPRNYNPIPSNNDIQRLPVGIGNSLPNQNFTTSFNSMYEQQQKPVQIHNVPPQIQQYLDKMDQEVNKESRNY